MNAFLSLDDLTAQNRTILLRADLNVPMQGGQVTDATRIRRIVPTIRELVQKKAKTVILSHFGRPKGKYDPGMSLAPLADALAQELNQNVKFGVDSVGPEAKSAVDRLQPGEVLLLENVRFHAGEESNDPAFAAALAELGEAYVNDAFSCSHRAHASVEGLARLLPAYAGRLMEEELNALNLALEKPAHPVAAIVGGSKVSTKLKLLGNLVSKVDILVIGGGMANTFLYAMGKPVGASLCEKDLKPTVEAILATAQKEGCDIILPEDVVVTKAFEPHAPCRVIPVEKTQPDDMILDLGPLTLAALATKLTQCKTAVWNGPIGAFETSPFDNATVTLARMIAGLTAKGTLKSVAGGGDTVAALRHAGLTDQLTYLSTAGGAFLEWMEGHELPGIAALQTAKAAA
ncbi:phosphoglycerate kinase [bacterium]|nr:phosphoglycerate kinase [bacterium]